MIQDQEVRASAGPGRQGEQHLDPRQDDRGRDEVPRQRGRRQAPAITGGARVAVGAPQRSVSAVISITLFQSK